MYSPPPLDISLSELFNTCLSRYRDLLSAVSEDKEPARAIDPQRVLEEYGRLKIWGQQTRASLPALERNSLESTLRHDQVLKGNVAAILHDLCGLLDHALSHIQPNPAAETNDDNSLGFDSDTSSCSYSDPSDDGKRPVTQRRKRPKLAISASYVFEKIQLLYRLASLLRRPGLTGRYLRSRRTGPEHPTELYDLRHVEEKLRQWRVKGAADTPREASAEAVATPEILESRTQVNADESNFNNWLFKRLAHANSQRREQFKYWAQHPYRPQDATTRQNNKSNAMNQNDKSNPRKTAASLPPIQPTQETQRQLQGGPKSIRSIPTAHTFSTVAHSAIDEDTKDQRSRTEYASSVVRGRHSSRVPNMPRHVGKENETHFECPYCHMDLSWNKSREDWKRHVFRDLRPYSCTFADCASPNKLYATRHEWKYHETQVHRRKWVCEECISSHDSRESMVLHLQHVHPRSFAPRRLDLLLSIAERPIDEADSIIQNSCPLCSITLPFPEAMSHLASHMEELSLFALPARHDENDDEDNDDNTNSRGAARRSSSGQIYDGEGESNGASLSSLNFDDEHESLANIPDPLVQLTEDESWDAYRNPEGHTLSSFREFDLTWEYDDPSTIERVKKVGDSYESQGQFLEAERMYTQALEGYKKVRGESHPHTMVIMDKLVIIMFKQGRWKEADDLGSQVVEIRKKELGAEHPDALTSMDLLANILMGQGRWREAEDLESQVLETRKKVLGIKHPDTLISMAGLTKLFRIQARWNEAEKLGRTVLEYRKEVFGERHPDALTSMARLAKIFWDQGRWKEAENLGRTVLEYRKEVLGERHPDTLTSMARLVAIYGMQQDRWKEAEELGIEVLEIRKKELGAEHPDTLIIMARLAKIFMGQGRWEEAEDLESQILETRKKVPGIEHPDTLTTMSRLAKIFWRQDRWKEAEKLETQVLEHRKEILGADHPDTKASKANLEMYAQRSRRVEDLDSDSRLQ